jgi:hypothetical protein
MSQCSVFNCAKLSSRDLLLTYVNSLLVSVELKDNSHLDSEATIDISESVHLDCMCLALSHRILVLMGIRIQHERSDPDKTCVAHKDINEVFCVVLSILNLRVMKRQKCKTTM